MACIRIIALAGTILSLAACRGGSPTESTPEQGVAAAQEEYLRFHTDAATLAQAEQNAQESREPALATAQGPTQPPQKPAPAATPVPPRVAEAAVRQPEPVEETTVRQPEPVEEAAVEQPAPPAPVQVAEAPPVAAPEPIEADDDAGDAALHALIGQPDVAGALQVLQDLASKNVLAQVEAVRILSAQRPPEAAHELYIAAFTKPSTFVRERALGALLTAFPDMADDWGRRLLATRGGRPEDRYDVARQVIANQTVSTYRAALDVLAEDYSGAALYAARDAILAAGDPIAMPLMRVALEHKGLPNAFVARRLYRWIQHAGRITEAYYDTFHENTSEFGVKLFSQRYGQHAKPLLIKALDGETSPQVQDYIKQALADLDNPEATPTPPRRARAANVLFLITYKTPAASKRILTDTPIWPDAQPGKINHHVHGRRSIRQKTIGMQPQQLAALRQLKPELLPTVKVDGEGIDRLDLRRE